MRTESLEYYIILTNSHPQKAWHPYDPVSHYTYDVGRLPRRAKFGTEYDAAAALPDCYAQRDRILAHYRSNKLWDALADAYAATEFKVAKVAITVDLLPQ